MITLPSIIGHRGAAALSPENTLVSFMKAAELGAQWIELDVHLAKGANLAVIHDATLERTTNGKGEVIRTSSEVLAKLDAGNGEPVPLLTQALTMADDLALGVNIELKGKSAYAEATVEALAACLKDHKGPVLISSFEDAMMVQALAKLPHVPRGALFSQLPENWATCAKAMAVSSIHLSNRHVRQSHVEDIKAAGYAVAVYTVNDPARAVALWQWGVDAIFSDLPPTMHKLLNNKS